MRPLLYLASLIVSSSLISLNATEILALTTREAVDEEKIAQASDKPNSHTAEGVAHLNQAILYSQEGRFEDAVGANQKAIESFQSQLSYSLELGNEASILENKGTISLAYVILSQTYEKLQQYSEGITAAKSALEIVNDTDARTQILEANTQIIVHYYRLSDFALIEKDYPKAIEYAEQALSYIQKSIPLAAEAVQVVGKDFPEGISPSFFIVSGEERETNIERTLTEKSLIVGHIIHIYQAQDNHAKVLEYGQQALEIYQAQPDNSNTFLTLSLMSQAYTQLGQYPEAIAAAKQTEVIAKNLSNPKYLFRAYGNIGKVYDESGRYPEAIEAYEAGLILATQQVGTDYDVLNFKNNLGILAIVQGQYRSALAGFEASLIVIHDLQEQVTAAVTVDEIDAVCPQGDNSEQSALNTEDGQSASVEALSNSYVASRRHNCLTANRIFEQNNLANTAFIYRSQGHYQAALDTYEKAIALAKEWDGPSAEGSLLGHISSTYADQGNYSEAMRLAEQSLLIYQQIDEPVNVAYSLTQLGDIYQFQGEYDQALSVYEEALNILQESESKPLESTIFNNISVVYREQGRYQEAKALLEQASSTNKELSRLSNQATVLINLSSIERDQGNYSLALKHLESSLKIYKEIGERPLEGTTLNLIGAVHDLQGSYSKAFTAHQAALVIAQSIGDLDEEANALSALGRTYDKLGQYEQAQIFYQDALAIFKDISDVTGEASVLSQLGENADKQGLYPAALSFYEAALKLHRQTGNVGRESLSLLNLGQVQINLNDLAGAEASLQQSLEIQERIGVRKDKAETLASLARVESEN